MALDTSAPRHYNIVRSLTVRPRTYFRSWGGPFFPVSPIRKEVFMEKKQIVGYEIHTLDHMIGRMIFSFQSSLTEKEGLTKMQSWIIGYLYENRDKAIFQKDIEAQFHTARSTATGILKLMEKKGFLIREPYPSDARLKRLVLTDKGISLQLNIMSNLELMEHKLKEGIPKEQLDVFFNVVHQIKRNTENNTI